MNFGTKLRTILVIATSLNTAMMSIDLTGFANPTIDTIYKIASVVLNFIIVFIAAYFNNDYTETAAKYTGMMRLEKEQSKGIITGENFQDEIEEDDYEEEYEDDFEEGGENE